MQSDSQLVQDTYLPRYHMAKLARFSPLAGKQAAIVDELGIHFVSMESKQETLFISQTSIDTLQYSPADNYVVTCEKFNQNNPDNTNLRIMDASLGTTVAQFAWRKPAKEGMKTLMWAPDESICLRMVPPEGPKEPNHVEVYRDCDFTQPAAQIYARFPRKGVNKKDPPIFVNGKFDGFALCPLNPANPETSPQYLFAW